MTTLAFQQGSGDSDVALARASYALWRELGEFLFTHHGQINLFWLPAQAVVNSSIVSDYVFPGAITGTWTHVEGIKAAR